MSRRSAEANCSKRARGTAARTSLTSSSFLLRPCRVLQVLGKDVRGKPVSSCTVANIELRVPSPVFSSRLRLAGYVDGQDYAYAGFAAPLDTTRPQTFSFAAARSGSAGT